MLHGGSGSNERDSLGVVAGGVAKQQRRVPAHRLLRCVDVINCTSYNSSKHTKDNPKWPVPNK